MTDCKSRIADALVAPARSIRAAAGRERAAARMQENSLENPETTLCNWRGRRALALALLWLLAGSIPSLAQKGAVTDSGEFFILSAQKRIGSEKFKITQDGSGFEAAGEIEVEMPGSPKVSETALLKLDRNLRPASYVREQKSPKKGSIAVEFGSPESKLTFQTDSGPQTRVFYLPEDHLAVLDTNFFHQYALVLRQYDTARGGAQPFNVFVPQEATPGTISLELAGQEAQQAGKAVLQLNHFRAITEQLKIDIWATPAGEIYRLSVPQANLEVVRQ